MDKDAALDLLQQKLLEGSRRRRDDPATSVDEERLREKLRDAEQANLQWEEYCNQLKTEKEAAEAEVAALLLVVSRAAPILAVAPARVTRRGGSAAGCC